jgi:uncharacterized repeat protein (TIGR01451 family)
MKKAILLLSILITGIAALSQTPGLQWQQTLGGNEFDVPAFTVKTSDNGVIVIGSSNSTTGNFSTNHGGYDLWVEKFNLQGISQWRRLMGGSGNEIPASYYYNTDGSIVILATTTSTDGDITNNHGATDIWVIKLSSSGTTTWQNCYGGTANETASGITKITPSGYIVSGSSLSNNGNLTNNWGAEDAWVFRLADNGVLSWQRNLGGTASEGVQMAKTIISADNFIYLLTETGSNSNDVSGNHGGTTTRDMWVVKLNLSTGATVLQRCLGGSANEIGTDIKQAPSGEIYVLGHANSIALPSFHGTTTDYTDYYFCRVSQLGVVNFQRCYGGTLSDIGLQIVSVEADGSAVLSGEVNNGGGDVIGYHGSSSGSDIWLLQVTTAGAITWQRALGGTFYDRIAGSSFDNLGTTGTGAVIKTADNGFLVSGFTLSSNGDVAGYHQPGADSSRTDLWVVKLSPTGVLDWQRSLGGKRGDLPRGAPVEMAPNDYMLAGYTNSVEGDVNTNRGKYDGWLLRIGASNMIKGTVYIDLNSNSIKEASEPLYSGATIQTQKPGDTRTTIPYNGIFQLDTDTGSYTTTLVSALPYYTPVPVSHPSTFTTYFNKDSFSYALQPIPGQQDLIIHVVPLNAARPGFHLGYKIYYINYGTTTIPAGEVLFKKDARLNFTGSSPSVTSISGDTLKWSYTNLEPQDTSSIVVSFQLQAPPNAVIGDTIESLAIITPVTGDVTPRDDTAIARQLVVGAYDPNDKVENFGGLITSQQVTTGDYITYTIRFQNTGTDTAFNIYIKDTLDPQLDWPTLQMVASSHPYLLDIDGGDKLTWNFYNIYLPDSNINEPLSHGFITYRIRPKTDLLVGDVIRNDASIYFDFNLPELTNQASTLVQANLVLPLNLLDFTAAYTSPAASLKWTTSGEYNVEKFEIERGNSPNHFSRVGNVIARNTGDETHYVFNDNLSAIAGDKFFYRLKMVDMDGRFSYSSVQLVRRDGKQVNEVIVNPNPVRGVSQVYINYDRNTMISLQVVDMQGRRLVNQQRMINKGYSVIPVDFSRLPAGQYLLQIRADGQWLTTKFVK